MAKTGGRKDARSVLYAGAGALAVLVVAGAVGLGVKPILDDRSAAIAETEATEAENSALAGRVADLNVKAADLDAQRQRVRTFADSLPGDADQQGLVTDLQAAAGRSGVAVTVLNSVTPVVGGSTAPVEDPAVTADASIAVVPLNLSIEGTSTASIAAFLSEVEGLDRTIVIDTVSVSAEAEPDSASITGRAFLARTLSDPAEEPVPAS